MVAECPVCGKPTEPQAKPFCSKRCADVDLYRWLKGGYAVPGSPLSPENPSENEPGQD